MKEEQRWKMELNVEKDKVKELRVLNENFATFIEILRQYHNDSKPIPPARTVKKESEASDWRSTLVKRD